jgi:CRP-like cAMP-binding protein
LPNSPFARKLQAFVALSDADLAILSELYRRRRSFQPGRDMLHQGQSDQVAYVLAEGWACGYVLLPDGDRQIIDIKVPGDLLGMRSMLFRTSDHNVEPISTVTASEFRTSDLIDAFSRAPRLATAVLWAASRDEAIVVEHLVGLGRRSAAQRTGHFLLELAARLKLVGMGDKAGYDCPLSQYVLADTLGLSAVHVNRVLRELREAGYVTFQNGRVGFMDLPGLIGFCEFDPSYLDHEGPLLK